MGEVRGRTERPIAVVAGIDWIVCRGATRDVVDGVVDCPAHGPIDVAECADCHFLEAVQAEWRQMECRTPER